MFKMLNLKPLIKLINNLLFINFKIQAGEARLSKYK